MLVLCMSLQYGCSHRGRQLVPEENGERVERGSEKEERKGKKRVRGRIQRFHFVLKKWTKEGRRGEN